jgi:isocitrate lyase
MVKHMDLAKYVVEEGLVGHHWEEILGPGKVLCHSRGECQGQEEGVGGLGSRGWG